MLSHLMGVEMDYTRIIISDLHVGQNDEFDIFAGPGKSELFAAFIDHVRGHDTPIELIINGDFVDFLQLRPWNDLSRATALTKINSIVTGSSRFFDDLGKVLKKPENKIVILPGNHDVELAYPEVGKVLRNAILKSAPGADDQIQLFDSSQARRTTHIAVINGVTVRIEHGNEGDPWNSLNYLSLFTDAETGTSDFSYPPGTELVYETMNDFKEIFRFVDLLKPEMPAVILILLALKPFMSALMVPAAALTGLKMIGNAALVALRRRVAGRQLGSASEFPVVTAHDQLKAFLTNELPQEIVTDHDLELYLENAGAPDGTMGPTLDRVMLWLLSWAIRGLARFQVQEQGEQFYRDDHPNNSAAKGGQARLEGDVKVVVFGHTHEALKTEFGDRVYVNSGTWANLIELPSDAGSSMRTWLEALAANRFKKTAFPTFIKIQPADSGGVHLSLNSWGDNGDKTLWKKNILPSNSHSPGQAPNPIDPG
jgi:UDP-2,3-diacylglucosamine pyrophosphatase LpxH